MKGQSTFRTRILMLILATLLFMGPALSTQAAVRSPYIQHVDQAINWLLTQQQADGSFGSPGQTCEVVLALAAAGRDVTAITKEGNSPLDYLALQADSYTSKGWDPANQTALLVQAVVAAGENPYDFGGLNLVERLNGFYQTDGSFGMGSQALASYLIALRALNRPIPPAAVAKLKASQLANGAWEYSAGWGPDLDATSKVLQGLVAAGEPLTSTVLARAVAYIRAEQKPHGGWQTSWDTDINPNTTAQVIQGLLAAGLNPLTEAVATTGATPIEGLLSTRNPTTGAFQFGGVDNVLATAQAVPALLGRTLPLYGRASLVGLAIDYLARQQRADGGFSSWGSTSDAGATLDAILGGVAADWEPRDWASAGRTTLDFLATVAVTYTTPMTSTWGTDVFTTTAVAQTGKLIAGVIAAEGQTVRGGQAEFAGLPLKARLDANLAWSPRDNSLADYAWAAIGYAALGETVPTTVTNRILALQESRGGWAFWGDYAYGTSLAVQALIAAGVSPTSTRIISATNFLRTLQDANTGGFAMAPGGQANIVATANVLAAISALGQKPWDFAVSSSVITLTVNTPDQWLLKAQSMSGDWGGTIPATGQVLQGLSGRALPFRLRPVVVSTGLERRTNLPWTSAFRARFNIELDPESVNTATFTLRGPQGVVASSVTYRDRWVTLRPSEPLAPGTKYRLTIQGVKGARRGAQGPTYYWDVVTALNRCYLPLLTRVQ